MSTAGKILSPLISVLLLVGIFFMAGCGTSNVPPTPKIADAWVHDQASDVWSTCSVYGDRLYALNGTVAVAAGGCR